jgi:hypothetical protein
VRKYELFGGCKGTEKGDWTKKGYDRIFPARNRFEGFNRRSLYEIELSYPKKSLQQGNRPPWKNLCVNELMAGILFGRAMDDRAADKEET